MREWRGARLLRYSVYVFAEKLIVYVVVNGERKPCPLDWLDSFSMRDFTRDAAFDETLPIADGVLEAGYQVDPQRLAKALGEWLTKRGAAQGQQVTVEVRKA